MANDSDKEFLGGCLFVAFTSLATILPPIIVCMLDQQAPPFRVYSNAGLQFLFGESVLISGVMGLILARLGGLAGSFGSFGGFLCGAAYWFMHLQQMVPKCLATTGVPTEYPDSTVFLVPLAWALIGAIVSFLPMFKNPRLKHKDS
ncbi:MAG: hypothetical protein WCK51_01920 [Armatimonadota bacterium]